MRSLRGGATIRDKVDAGERDTPSMSPEFSVRSGRAVLAARRFGSGPTVVFLHPGVADQRCWNDVMERLARTHAVVSYDRRGFGSTEYEAEPHRPIDDLRAILDAAGIQRAHIVGNSMGGRLAVDFALAEPHRVSSLVLVAASIDGAPSPDTLPSAVEELFDEIERLEQTADLDAVNELEARIWLDGPSRRPGHVEGRARELFLEMNGRALRAAPTGEVDGEGETPAWERLSELAVPVLAVVGAHDLPHINERTVNLGAVIDGARTLVLDESAHVPQLDDPAALSELLAEFFGSLQPDRQ
jgi:pimeloyl-ACP methyl ester carboxylesterase